MSRAFGLVAAICSLAIVAILMALNMSQNGPTSHTAKRAEAQATAAVGSLNFTGAATELEAYKAEHATYAGAALAPAFGVTVMRADATSSWVLAGVGLWFHLFLGRGAPPATGPC